MSFVRGAKQIIMQAKERISDTGLAIRGLTEKPQSTRKAKLPTLFARHIPAKRLKNGAFLLIQNLVMKNEQQKLQG